MEKSSQGDLTDIIRNKTFILSDDKAFIDPFPGSKDPTGDYGVSAKKRRKSQAKKVVCIPAPAASSGRPNGEAVPSDLWAWRKYGQKPIKGSPYPRGYYRCSSSKGCSARKQVERSRTDPSMLTITYTSEHNHPWPAQRNSLAGSTRSLPSSSNPHSLEQQPKQEPHLYLDHFFDDLAELDFKEGFLGENGSSGCSKAADPFSMFDWGDLMEEKRGV